MAEDIKKYIKEIEKIATQCSCSQSDGYAQIMRICDAINEALDGEEVGCFNEARITETHENTTTYVSKLVNTCCHCKHSEGIEGRNSMLGCNIDGKLHDMEDTCLCFEAVYKFNIQTGLPERMK